MALTAEEKNMVCPRLINFDRFAYTRKNINISNVSYECKHKRRNGGMCNAKLQFNRCTFSGKVDFDNKIAAGQHLRRCYSLNGMKPPLIVHDEDGDSSKENVHPNRLPMVSSSESSNNLIEKHVDKRIRVTDVTEEMKNYADELATTSLTIQPAKIWEQTKANMDEEYPNGWTGVKKTSITARVPKIRSQMNGGDAFCTLQNSTYALMTDTDRPFLQHNGVYPNFKTPGTFERILVFGNPSHFGLLQLTNLDIYIDATFDCCPCPFYQCLIVMAFHQETNVYVPLLYILMTSKTQELYCHALNHVVSLSDWKLHVNSYTSDFELAIMNSCKLIFGRESFHIGCLFHLKQAWRRHLITKLGFLAEEVALAMKVGVLDLLCIIPPNEIREFGIPFVRLIVEEDLSAAAIAKWDIFWIYFDKQWMSKVDNWNICNEDGSYKKFMNRTNNGLESYNRRFNGLFTKLHPSLIEFAEIVEKESRYYATKLDDIRHGKENRPKYAEKTIPNIPAEYTAYKQNR